jgi:type IV fimbrial biogenesis protein FimT
MRSFGFTLIDLLTTLTILSVLLIIGIPSFSAQIQKTRVKTATQSLLEAMDLTRTQAVFSNSRTTIANQTEWENGWEIFVDKNNNGIREEDEKLVQQHEKFEGIRIIANKWIKNNVSYIGSGESRNAAGTDSGAFQAGTFTICPESKGTGYQLILARGGRVRMLEIKAEKCDSI